jgi:hypothetical protein
MKADLKNSGLAILAGGAAAGAADIISAIGGQKSPLGVLQYIGSGLLGKVAFDGGWWTGAAGLAVHFGLTTIMAALFVLAARRWSLLLCSSWLSGFIYGALLYAAMFYFIVPYLTAASGWKTPQGFLANLKGAMLHGFLVGVPIAAAAKHFLTRKFD